ncbi:hydrolase [Cytophagales bacterium WSM2-2]|nr:hydrolase [Cytophagales bacterium WSM2-2]
MISNGTKNLIFDLGGVIMDLDFSKTYEAFSKLAKLPVPALKEKMPQVTFFNEYEKGLITDFEFRHQLRLFLNSEVSDQEIDIAWNAMLLDITRERLDLLTRLQSKYNTFLLSNTNSIHLRVVNETVFRSSGVRELDAFFRKAYYSHLMRLRKPDPEIFKQVLKENNLQAAETLFMDDIAENINGAKSVGIQTIQITSTNQILSLFA